MAKKLIFETNIKRDKNKLYFCGTDSNGNLVIYETEMVRGRKKKNKKEGGEEDGRK